MNVVTRFAPSPTGFLHMGSVRTALYLFLYARQHRGTFVLRIEDTDAARNKPEWTTGLVEDLGWLGLHHDIFVIQSERAPIHTKYLKKMIEEGKAYVSKETPTEEGQRDEVIRFKNPNKVVAFADVIRGEISIDTTDLGDFVIARSLNEPLYHLAVVADDFDMGITHVIRAEEHISNTPRQILIQEAIGAPRPIYAHLPLVLAADKSKLSKRKHGETVWLTYYRSRGYLPAAIINFVALLGWNPGDEREIFSLEELIKEFSLEKVQKGGGVFNIDKLNWINKEYIKKMGPEEQLVGLRPFVPENVDDELLRKLVPTLIDRVNYWGEAKDLFEAGEFEYLFNEPHISPEKLAWKGESLAVVREYLTEVINRIRSIDDGSWQSATVKEAIWPYAEEKGRGNVLWPTRMALTGKEKSADPFTVATLLGKEKTMSRLEHALQSLSTS
jgi:glutamyl-tRNA synthetase